MSTIQILDANGATQQLMTTLNGSVNSPWHVISDGTNTATIGVLSHSNALTVQIVDGSGDQITSFGGSDAADGTIGAAVGTVAIMVGAESSTGHVAFLNLDSSGNLKVVNTGGGSNAAAGLTGSAVPTSASYTGFDVAGNLIGVSVSNPFPVTGTVAATQSGTWTVQQGGAPWSANIEASGSALTATGSSLNVNVTGGSTGNGAASNTGSAVPAQAGYTGFNSGGNLVGVSSGNPLPVTAVQGTSPWIVAGGGTAGTPGTAVLTIQGVSGGTAINVSSTASGST